MSYIPDASHTPVSADEVAALLGEPMERARQELEDALGAFLAAGGEIGEIGS